MDQHSSNHFLMLFHIQQRNNLLKGVRLHDFWVSLALTVKYYLEENFESFPNWMDDEIKEQLNKIYQNRNRKSYHSMTFGYMEL